jgi:hypothetical protein
MPRGSMADMPPDIQDRYRQDDIQIGILCPHHPAKALDI